MRIAIRLNPDHIHSQHLLALLLSAQKQHDKALEVINCLLDEYPDNFKYVCTFNALCTSTFVKHVICCSLMFSKSRLEEAVLGADVALLTCKDMLTNWKKFFEPQDEYVTSAILFVYILKELIM